MRFKKDLKKRRCNPEKNDVEVCPEQRAKIRGDREQGGRSKRRNIDTVRAEWIE